MQGAGVHVAQQHGTGGSLPIITLSKHRTYVSDLAGTLLDIPPRKEDLESGLGPARDQNRLESDKHVALWETRS